MSRIHVPTLAALVFIAKFLCTSQLFYYIDDENVWSTWTTWNCTSDNCTDQTVVRERSCFNYFYNTSNFCNPVVEEQTSTCYEVCRVDGRWASWDGWSDCLENRTQTRTRTCTNPPPTLRGWYCPGASNETQGCCPYACSERDYVSNGSLQLPLVKSLSPESGEGVVAATVDCHGVISQWQFYASRHGEIRFQIWRSDTSHTLLGENIYFLPENTTATFITFIVPELQRINVQSTTDSIGWYSPGGSMIPYTVSSNTSLKVYVRNTSPWTTANEHAGRLYVMRATTANSISPYILNVNATIQVPRTVAVSTSVYTVMVFEDLLDQLTVTQTGWTDYFNYTNGSVSVVSPPMPGTYNIVLRVEDSCLLTTSGTLTIHVSNKAPNITLKPDSIFVQSHQANTPTFTVLTSDPEGNDVTCSATPSYTNFPFTISKIQNSTDQWTFSLTQDTSVAMDTTTYLLRVECSDGFNASSRILPVYTTGNQPPQFLNLPDEIVLNASQVAVGDAVFTVRLSDPENDTLTYTLTSSPPNAPFEVFPSGDIHTTQDLSSIDQAGYDLEITVHDAKRSIPARHLSVLLRDTYAMKAPVIGSLSLPWAVPILENTPLDTLLYRVQSNDYDLQDVMSYSASFNTSGTQYISINETTGDVTLTSAVLDYETVPATGMMMTIFVTDAMYTATGTMSFTLADQNEQCSFNSSHYHVRANEGNVSETFTIAAIGVIDEDESDNHTYTLDCGEDSWRFYMDADTGVISYAYPYDLDQERRNLYECMVTARDSGALTCSARLSVHIDDVNDNYPEFYAHELSFFVSPDQEVGSEIGNVVAQDRDVSSAYGAVHYHVNMTSYPKQYIAVNSSGTVYVNEELTDFSRGDAIYLLLTASDPEGNNSTVFLRIIFPEVTTTTSGSRSFWKSKTNIAMVTVIAVLSIVCISVICVIVHRHFLKCRTQKNVSGTMERQTALRKQTLHRSTKIHGPSSLGPRHGLTEEMEMPRMSRVRTAWTGPKTK